VLTFDLSALSETKSFEHSYWPDQLGDFQGCDWLRPTVYPRPALRGESSICSIQCEMAIAEAGSIEYETAIAQSGSWMV
jgi:hypothetical protein